jgi:hypothetical protein
MGKSNGKKIEGFLAVYQFEFNILPSLRGTKQSLIYVISSIDCFVPRNDEYFQIETPEDFLQRNHW